MSQIGIKPIEYETVLDFGSIGPTEVADRVVKVQGAQVGFLVFACVHALQDGMIFFSWVDQPNVVKVRMANVSEKPKAVGKLYIKLIVWPMAREVTTGMLQGAPLELF